MSETHEDSDLNGWPTSDRECADMANRSMYYYQSQPDVSSGNVSSFLWMTGIAVIVATGAWWIFS